MRIELLFQLEKPELPKDNKSTWISYLKHVISQCNDGKYFDRYFSQKRSKDYSFGLVLSKPVFGDEKIILSDTNIKMIFSASDKNKTGMIFFSAFIGDKGKKFRMPDGNAMVLKSIRLLKEKVITSRQIIVKTVVGGGLVIREHDRSSNKDIYFTVNDDQFVEKANNTLKIQSKEAGFSDEISDTLNIQPLNCKKVVVKQYGVYVDVSIGLFQLEGDEELLQYFYQAGLGSKHSMGYGLIDIVSQDVN